MRSRVPNVINVSEVGIAMQCLLTYELFINKPIPANLKSYKEHKYWSTLEEEAEQHERHTGGDVSLGQGHYSHFELELTKNKV